MEVVMKNRYELITYCDEDKKMLDNALLTNEEKLILNNLKIRMKDKTYSPIIEALYKFNKSNYSPSDLSEIFKVSTRQIQLIFKDLGINRDRYEAQQIAVGKRDYEGIRKAYKNTILEKLSDTKQFEFSSDQYVRYQVYILLSELLPECEVIVGISSMDIVNNEIDIPIIIINRNSLYKYIILFDTSIASKKEPVKNRNKNKNLKAFYKGYTLFKISSKAYFDLSDNPKIKYEREIKSRLLEIVNSVTSEVLDNNTYSKLE